MRLQVSKCYYHPDRGAVATCAKCGVGICEYCAVKDAQGKIICYRCGNKDLKQEHKEYRKLLKDRGGRFRKGTEFIVPGIIGILFVAIVLKALAYFGGISDPIIRGWGNIVYVFIGYMVFSIPFCYIVVNDWFAPKYDTAYNKFSEWYLKLAISLMIGWLVFTFLWIRFIVRKIMPPKSET